METHTFAHAETPASPDERKKLRLREGSRVYRYDQLRHRNGVVVAYDRVALPHALLPNLDMQRVSGMTLHELAQQCGWLLGEVVEEVEKTTAPLDVAALLGMSEAGLVLVDRVTFTASGQPLEWRVIYSKL